MMKRTQAISVIALALCLVWGMSAVPALAAGGGKVTQIDLAARQSAPGLSVDSIVENHPDIAPEHENTANTVYTITQNGVYRFSGTLENGQIRVDAPGADNIEIRLNGITLTNHTAPVLYIKDAMETDDTASASVTILLESDTHSSLVGSHYAEHNDAQGREIDHDGAISSAVTLMFSGGGSLDLQADNEGIEGQMHLIFNGGDIAISAHDDAINGSNDDISHIVFNAGRILANSTLGDEGDGVDSNGFITINGGTLIALANPQSMDSGLDSDLGITINGGIVAASGNMYDQISENSAQRFIHLSFAMTGQAGEPVVLSGEAGTALIAFSPPVRYTQLTLSSPDLLAGEYQLSVGGILDTQAQDGLFPLNSAYTPGALQQHSASTGVGDRPGGFPGRDPGTTRGRRPDSADPPPQPPEGQQPPQLPEGQQPRFPEGQQPQLTGQSAAPAGGDTSTIFSLSGQSNLFSGIQNAD